jgi:cytidine deaminase
MTAVDRLRAPQVLALIRAARSVRRRAHAPYSGFQVGAAVLTASGVVVGGCNVENASLGLSICAERAAVHRAIAEGHRRLVAVAISSGLASAPPCGACRQVLAEFGVRTVVIDRPRLGPLVLDLRELLAHPFVGTRLRRRRHPERSSAS